MEDTVDDDGGLQYKKDGKEDPEVPVFGLVMKDKHAGHSTQPSEQGGTDK